MKKQILSERADLFDPNMTIIMMFEIVGAADPHIFAEAAGYTFHLFEAAMSRIVIEKDGLAYYETQKECRCTAEITDRDFDSLIAEYKTKPLDIGRGEMMRIFFSKSDCKTDVLILSHHLTGDGKSVVYFIEQMMREAAGEARLDKFYPLVLLNEDTLPEETGISNFYRWLAGRYNQKWNNASTFSMDDREKLYHSYWGGRQSVILKAHLSPQTVLHIHTKSKDIGVSVNSLLFAAFMKFNTRYKTAGLAINARKDNNRSMSNQATGITVRYAYHHNLSFERNVQIIHKKISVKLKNPKSKYFILHFIPMFAPSLIDSVLMASCGLCDNKTSKKLAALLGYAPVNKNALSITNLTKLDIECKYREYEIKNFYFVPPVVSYGYQTFGIATLPDGMGVSLHSLTDRFTDNEKRAFDDTIAYLESNFKTC